MLHKTVHQPYPSHGVPLLAIGMHVLIFLLCVIHRFFNYFLEPQIAVNVYATRLVSSILFCNSVYWVSVEVFRICFPLISISKIRLCATAIDRQAVVIVSVQLLAVGVIAAVLTMVVFVWLEILQVGLEREA